MLSLSSSTPCRHILCRQELGVTGPVASMSVPLPTKSSTVGPYGRLCMPVIGMPAHAAYIVTNCGGFMLISPHPMKMLVVPQLLSELAGPATSGPPSFPSSRRPASTVSTEERLACRCAPVELKACSSHSWHSTSSPQQRTFLVEQHIGVGPTMHLMLQLASLHSPVLPRAARSKSCSVLSKAPRVGAPARISLTTAQLTLRYATASMHAACHGTCVCLEPFRLLATCMIIAGASTTQRHAAPSKGMPSPSQSKTPTNIPTLR
jgi:hypothetical protein